MAEYCEANPKSVNFVGNAPRGGGHQNYGNTFNPSWRNRPNFSWVGISKISIPAKHNSGQTL